ncbi:hypothetical protein [Mycolicibacterium palauense]|uniref:hypothetical protein n=1 Tax=Mycolicibacterium palauense TaxID=2034511 RepID=UPI000BFF168F|nr:hypothetical protein [Mycolicibacterium palauense]
MSALGVFLVAVGVADIVRRLTDRTALGALAGVTAVIVTTAVCGLWHLGDVVLLVPAAGACPAWVWLGARAEASGRHEGAALAVFGGAAAVLLVLAGLGSPVTGPAAHWLTWVGLAGVAPDTALLAVGALLVQLVTGNQLVRLVLGAVGAVRPAGEPQPSDRLRGGRLLGPMERMLIMGLGLGGQLGLASAVVAAKGIIRFPELSAQRRNDKDGSGIDQVVEYFLVGSFASWIVAMAGLALALH